MIKQFLKISFYSIITYCTLDYISSIYWIFFQSATKETPEIWLGIPFNFYKLYPNENMGYSKYLDWTNFFYNILVFWILVFLYFIFKNNKQQTKNNKQQNE